MAIEQEIEKYWDQSNKVQDELNQNNSTYSCYMPNLQFDESDTYLCFGSAHGIKVLNTKTNGLSRVLGKLESSERFLKIALYQGKPIKQQTSSGAVNVHAKSSAQEAKMDPTFICNAFKRSRFYMFT